MHASPFEAPREVGPQLRWRGQALTLRAALIPRYLWTTASIDLYLGDRCVLRSGGQLKVVGSARQRFEADGATHEALITWGTSMGGSFPVEVRIDDEVIGQLAARIENRHMILVAVALIAAGAQLALWLVRHLVR